MLKKRSVLTAGLLSALFISTLTFPANAAEASLVTSDPAAIQMECADSANVLKDANWNFEDDEKYWHLTNTVDGLGSAYYYTMAITNDNPHEGESSLMLDGVGGWANIQVPIHVKKNTQYTFSMWVHASEGWNGAKNSVIKMVGHSDGDYLNSSSIVPITGDMGFNYTGEWEQWGFVINTGDCDLVSLFIADGGGSIYFDELRFFETDNPNGEAATEPANLQKIREQEAKENPPETETPSTPSTTVGNQNNTTAMSTENTVPTTEDTEDTDVAPSQSDKSDSTSTAAAGPVQPEDANGGNSPLIVILIVVAVLVVLGGGGFTLWYFKIRKKPDASEKP